MKKVRYIGVIDAILPTINKVVKNGDVIEVDDNFQNALFEAVVEEKVETKNSKANKEVTE